MPYRAQGAGQFGGTVFPDTRPQIDVGAIFDALGSGANSIIQTNLAKNQTLRNNAIQNAQIARETAQQQAEMDRWNREFTAEQAQRTIENQRADAAAKAAQGNAATELEIKRAQAGYVPPVAAVPASATGGAQVTGSVPTPSGLSPLASAMAPTAPLTTAPSTGPGGVQLPGMYAAGGAPTPTQEVAPATSPTLSRAPIAETPGTPGAAAHYDPEQAAKYVQATAVANARALGMTTAEEVREQDRERLAGINNQYRTTATQHADQFKTQFLEAQTDAGIKKGTALKSVPTAAQTQTTKNAAAQSLMFDMGAGDATQTSGALQRALDYLDTPEGKQAYPMLAGDPNLASLLDTGRRNAMKAITTPGTEPIASEPKPVAAPPGPAPAPRAGGAALQPTASQLTGNPDPQSAAAEVWIRANPQQAGETPAQYKARWQASLKPPGQ